MCTTGNGWPRLQADIVLRAFVTQVVWPTPPIYLISNYVRLDVHIYTLDVCMRVRWGPLSMTGEGQGTGVPHVWGYEMKVRMLFMKSGRLIDPECFCKGEITRCKPRSLLFLLQCKNRWGGFLPCVKTLRTLKGAVRSNPKAFPIPLLKKWFVFSIFPLFFSCPQQLNRWPCHSLTH